MLQFVRFRVRSSSRESVREYRSGDIKRVGTLPNRSKFAITVASQGRSKRLFRVGRHNNKERKSVA